MLFQPADHFPRRFHQRGLDLVRFGVERGGLVLCSMDARQTSGPLAISVVSMTEVAGGLEIATLTIRHYPELAPPF